MEMRILDVEARGDIVDTLVWQVELRLSGLSTGHLFLLAGWSGDIVLYKQNIRKGVGMGTQVIRRHLPARWQRFDDRGSVRVWSGATRTLTMETQLPGDALERIETFRGDDRLFARLEGGVFALRVRGEPSQESMHRLEELLFDTLGAHTRQTEEIWQSTALWRDLADPQRILNFTINSESYELSRDRWNQSISSELRPQREASANHARVQHSVLIPDVLMAAKQAFEHRDFERCINECVRFAREVYEQMRGRNPGVMHRNHVRIVRQHAKFIVDTASDLSDVPMEPVASLTLGGAASLFQLALPFRAPGTGGNENWG